ncbi:MAG: CocE/NonD family hydrolase, partial [Acidobacteria bacterium]|nr:CocE/NonD family hydrolase [Acidobacteriota bacterium]
MRRILRYLLIAIALAIGGIALAATFITLPAEQKTPSGHTRNEAVYVTTRDGVKIAADIWYPPELQRRQKVPTLVRGTRYVRAWGVAWGAKAMTVLGLAHAGSPSRGTETFNREGFAVVVIDARGTGASFGNVSIPFGPEEIADYHEVINWIAQQAWSNSKVGALGVSYDGMSAEGMAAGAPPALRAVAP